jgi:uncharacterized DUF497 family protein
MIGGEWKSMPVYAELEFDDENIAEIEAHDGLKIEDVSAVFEGIPKFFPNKRVRAGTRLMIGPDSSNRIIAVPIVETAVKGRWRPITAWLASKAQRTRWRQAK